MDISPTPAQEEFRAEVRRWLTTNKPSVPMPSGDTIAGVGAHLEWERKLFDGGWAVVSWPREYGGRDANLWEWLIFEDEYFRAGLPQRASQNGIFLLAPSLFEFGTQEQKDRILPRMASVQDLWCQGWSEPNSGSDLASLTSRASRDDAGGGWRLNGQKTWTTRGAVCTHLFGLFRTDPAAERHRGLTYMLVDLRQPGVTVRPVRKLDGDEGFAEVFFDDVFVPDRDVLGEVNNGWSVAMATTGSERGLTLRSPGRFNAVTTKLVSLYRERVAEGQPLDPNLRGEVADGWMAARAYELTTWMTVTRLSRGDKMGLEASLNKVFWSEMDIRLHETALRLLGDEAEFESPWMSGYQFALAGPIYAGTNEIQRNIIAERLLGLPRS
ncbi:acyl-CoA dehydrogenase family protein [Mycobacterium sp.]|uniref:acyl-CoA dehydrogenase family protein n=1 Tax=Mycobacterium sp. TaxID=1785 RepID=UPI002C9DB65A|nr:acyl-CoA dehydrogenase family protein [Mycobacterium sp.]HKP44069.1 acyl-CoA dehydrogenase family protein [Mycobacterium sp.]